MKLPRVRSMAIILSAGAWLAHSPANAQRQGDSASRVPRLVKYAGGVRASAGAVRAGATSVTFAVYAEAKGGAALWQETQNVALDADGR